MGALTRAIGLLPCSFKQSNKVEGRRNADGPLYRPVNGELPEDGLVTPFANAGFFSRISFWWLNSLMRKGYEKPLEENDIPRLSENDRAENCYSLFLEKSNKWKQSNQMGASLIFWTIVSCHRNEILVSGFFALLKVLLLSSGPVLLNSFINVSSDKEGFRYEGYLLAIGLFLAKFLESLSQRQWYFRTRRLGLQLRSLLVAAIYQKQLKLSNSSKLVHSSGEIMNYATVDAYRIGEFPYWFHRTWTTSFQLCLALIILYNSVGLATISAVVMVILTVACNVPLARLQHKFQSKLMVAQDERLKTMSEALVYMKMLKLYAWETHFKKVIEGLREVESKWLSEFQFQRAYNSCLFWISPILVSAATFSTCYFLGIPLNAGNVFTCVATLRLVQDPVMLIPDVIRTVIQAKVAFTRIVKFLDALELQSVHSGRKNYAEVKDPVMIKSASFSWDGHLSKPTLRGINLVVQAREKVALCGEVGSGKSSLLAAILGEIPKTDGMEYVVGALSDKTVLLVTHQVDFLPAFNSILLMSDGQVLQAAPFEKLLACSTEFQDLFHAHKGTVGSEYFEKLVSHETNKFSRREISCAQYIKPPQMDKASEIDQLIKKEEREKGGIGFKPYLQYLNQNKGILYALLSVLCHVIFIAGQISQNSWMAANVQNPQMSILMLISVYLAIGFSSAIFVLFRSILVVVLGIQSSKSLFAQLLNSLFCAPMSFFDATPLGRILSRLSSDLSIIDHDIPFGLMFCFWSTLTAIGNFSVLVVVTWQVLFVSVPLVYLTLRLEMYYFAAAKELMRLNGTTRSLLANHLAESISGTITIRAFKVEHQFLAKNYELIDKNASPFFHNFAATEWLIQRLEIVSSIILSSLALVLVLLPPGTFSPGFIGMAMSYGFSLNGSIVFAIQNQCTIANHIISVERVNQYMHVPSEAPEVIKGNRPPSCWPAVGRVELQNLQIRYRTDTPLVLKGICCKFEGGHKIGIVGRTGSGKSTLIGALFRLVEPSGGKIIIDGLDITKIGLHDLRSRIGIIPQDPTLFRGSVRYNLDPLRQYTDQQIWEVLEKCHLREAILEKEQGLDSVVVEDGSNWSMGQRQLFCLGRALLRRSQILVLDEATASIDNATDVIIQKTIRMEFAKCTVITVAHRIPTVMDCTMVLVISDGQRMEYDEPKRLMKTEGSLFGELVKEYWSHAANPVI